MRQTMVFAFCTAIYKTLYAVVSNIFCESLQIVFGGGDGSLDSKGYRAMAYT